MKAIINFVGRFIRVFNRKVAALMTVTLAVTPVLAFVAVYLYFEMSGLVLAGLVFCGVVMELVWALSVGVWWDEHFSESSRVVTFPRRR